MKHKFYDKDGCEARSPRGKNMMFGKEGEILPKYDEKGRQIVRFTDYGDPIVKLKFRKSMHILYEIKSQLEMVDKYTGLMQDFIGGRSEEVTSQLKEITVKYPQATEFIEQLCLKHAEVWYYLGRWDGLRYAAGERFCFRFFSSIKAVAAGIQYCWTKLECELLPRACSLLLQSIFV